MMREEEKGGGERKESKFVWLICLEKKPDGLPFGREETIQNAPLDVHQGKGEKGKGKLRMISREDSLRSIGLREGKARIF